MALSNAERQAQWRQRRKTELDSLLRAALRNDNAEIKKLRARVKELNREVRFLRNRLASEPLPPEVPARLHKVLGMLGSHGAGERDNAFRAADKLMSEHRITWPQLLRYRAAPVR
jgi:hypothetical protein